jgi:ubiquinone/menaquinone biosynthesis C-methylase UbiE
MSAESPIDRTDHTRRTREAYDRLAPVWSATTDEGPFNGLLERPALRSLIPSPLAGRTILDAGCGSGGQAEWLLEHGADVIGVDLSPAMVEQARVRCAGRGRFVVADLAEPLPLEAQSVDGITCSLALHYLEDWAVALTSFAQVLRAGGWVVLSLDHPLARPLPAQRGSYFDTELVCDTWTKADVEVTQWFWRRPLAAVVDAFAEHGFLLERVAEARPSEDAVARFPDELSDLVGQPSFIVYRLRLSTSIGSVPRKRRDSDEYPTQW